MPEDCTIVYHVESLSQNNIQLKFLRDRRKYSINRVKLIIPPKGVEN